MSAAMDKQWSGHTQHDRQSNLGRKKWLTDSIMNAAQTMLADQFSMTMGFQSTNAGLYMTFYN